MSDIRKFLQRRTKKHDFSNKSETREDQTSGKLDK